MKNINFWIPKLMRAIQELDKTSTPDSIQQAISYIVQLDESEKQHPTSNMDEIMNWRVLPEFLNKELAFDTVLDLLVTGFNSFPLFVKVEPYQGSSKIVLLRISKRFRKWKEIQSWHMANEFAPFIIQTH